MDKIQPITFQKMKNDSHNVFMNDVQGLLANENMPLQGFEKLIETFNLAYQSEVSALRVRRKSERTNELVKINKQREEIYAGLFYHYQSSLRHYDAGKREAAKGISHIMKSIAYIHNMSNTNRGGSIHKIISNIRKPQNTEIVETLQLAGWLDALDALNELYQKTDDSRNSERSKRGNGNVLVARKVTDKAYQEIVARVNAVMLLNGTEEFDYFVRLLNVHLAHAKKSIAIRDGWKRHKKEEKKDE